MSKRFLVRYRSLKALFLVTEKLDLFSSVLLSGPFESLSEPEKLNSEKKLAAAVAVEAIGLVSSVTFSLRTQGGCLQSLFFIIQLTHIYYTCLCLSP